MGINILGRERLITGYAEKREAAPVVALLDNFEGAETSTSHGEMTESVLLGTGLQDADVQRYRCGVDNPIPVEMILQAPPEKIGGALRAHVGLAGALLLKATSADLRQILTEQPGVKVVSQSQSQSAVRVAQPFYEAAVKDADFRGRLGQALGVGADADLLRVGDQLFHVAETFLRDEEAVKDAKKEFLELQRVAAERGMVHVVAAGNLGEFGAELERKGHQLSPSAFRSIFVTDHSTVVGSLDENGSPASFNSPRSGIEVVGPGVNLPFSDATPGPAGTTETQYGSGTSLTVPLVAGKAAKLLADNPGWGAFEVEAHLTGVQATRLSAGKEAAVVVKGGAETLRADGQVDEFVLKAIGQGFISGLNDESVPQFVESDKAFRLVLPGETPDVNQVIDCRDNGTGQRKFTLDTFYGPHRHTVRGEYAHGAWIPERTSEEFYLHPEQ